MGHGAKSLDELSPVELHAIKIAGKQADRVRDRLDVGTEQEVDFLVRVHGQVDVAEGQSATIRERIAPLTLLALVFGELGPKTRSNVLLAVTNACAEYREEGREPEPTPDAMDYASDLFEAASRPKQQPRSGNVTGRIKADRAD